MSLYDNAALVCIPSGYKAGTLYSVKPNTAVGDFTVTRAGDTATRINSDLEIEEVAVNVPRLNYFTASGCPQLLTEHTRTNLLGYSESFGNSYWTKSGATIEGDASTAGSELVTDTGFDNPLDWTSSNAAIEVVGGKCVYTSAPTVNYILHSTIATAGNTYKVVFTIENYTSGGIYVTVGGTGGLNSATKSANGTYTVYLINQATAGIGNIYFKASGTTTLDIDNVSVKEVSGFSSPSADYPLGAFKLVASANDGYIQLASALTSGGTDYYSNSIFIKRATGTGTISLADVTGAYTDISTLNSTAVADGWYRYDVTEQSAGTEQIGVKLGTSGDEVYLYGADVEDGGASSSYPTSYIRSEAGGTVTRNRDEVSLTDLQTNNILGATTGTIVFEVDAGDATGSDVDLWIFEDTGAGDELALRYNADETWQWYDHHSTELIGTASASSSTKIAITWSGTAAIISKDGASEVITLSAAFDAITDVSIGASAESCNTKLMYMSDTYMSAANLNTLTTP